MAKNFTWRHFTAATLLCFFFSTTFKGVNAQCDATTKPTFGFTFNGDQVSNINNGSVDASELATLTTCDGESYYTGYYYNSSEANLYLVNNAVSGGTLLLNGKTAITNSQSVLTVAQFSVELGALRFQSLNLADPGVGGSFIQTITPFTDANNNRILDDGDCAGEPIVFTFTVAPILTWYADFDGDLHARSTMQACLNPGPGWTATVLPLDDCNDNDDQNTTPTFGYIVNNIGVYNINNGSVDPSESATLTLCEGERYSVDGQHNGTQYNLYKIANVVSGDALLFDGGAVTNSDTVLNVAEWKRTEGTHSFTLVDPGENGSTLVKTMTPFLDANNNRILDDGDCVGEPIVFTFIITAGSRWYKDVDGDLHASTTRRSCLSPGPGWTTTKLPKDDCDDNDANNAGPTFGFNFNGTDVYNINNGSRDPSESAAVTICEGGSYSVSGHFHNSESNLYRITNVVSGGALLFNGTVVTNSESVATAAQFSSSAGTYTLRLVEPGVSGTLLQTVTPYRDLNNNNILDNGDCVGERIVFTYTVTSGVTWYKDFDGDLHASETTRSCSSPGQGWTTTVLPVDDSNDDDNPNSGPIFGYKINGTAVYNINNGSVDSSESGTLTLCDGETYTTSGHFHSSEANLYVINNAVSGGALLLDGAIFLINNETVITAAQFTSTAGTHMFNLVDPDVSGTLLQTVTPFVDNNNNGILDPGDNAGEPIVFTYTITPKLTWYKDFDGDLHASDSTRSCASPGQGWTTTILPVDDCNDNDINNSGATFGFDFNGTAVYNINNGSVDPSESATLTICDGESYTVSAHFHSSQANLYVINNAVSGGAFLFDGGLVINAESVVTAAQINYTAGPHTFGLVDPDVSGTLFQTITPFVDNNSNGILDAGDCAGEPIAFTYTISTKLTWYKDVDGDLHASETTRSCSSPGQGWTTTILPVDDCDDDNTQNSGPTFGFNFNGTSAYNINNGYVEPSESVALAICDGETYTTSGHFHSSEANLYVINNAVSGGAFLFDGGLVINAESVVTAAQINYTAGSHTLILVNPAIGGMLTQKITPFTDMNHNQVLDAGDCVGDPILFTYTVTPGSKTWYKDADGDGYGSQSCHVRACVKPAGYVSNNTDCDDHNKLVHKPITYYRDADGDGYGDPTSSVCVCKSNAPAGYVKNNYDWNDHKKAATPGDERITMCRDGITECVYVKNIGKRICRGWKLGACSNSADKASKNAIDGPEKSARYSVDESVPEEYSLSNYPNPFKGTSTIKYALPVDSKVLIVVYDIMGRNLATLVNENKKAGNYSVNFNAVGLTNGIYYYRIAAKSSEGQFDQTNKMVLAR